MTDFVNETDWSRYTIADLLAEIDELQRRVDELEAALRDATGDSGDPDSVDWPPTEDTP